MKWLVVVSRRKSDLMFWCNVYSRKKDLLVVICDKELLGKKLKMSEKNIAIEVSEKFYGGELIDEDAALKLMNKATIGNLMGEKIVELAKKNGFIVKENVILIDGVPHAQFVKI